MPNKGERIIATEVFSEQQTSDDVLKILGYTKKAEEVLK